MNKKQFIQELEKVTGLDNSKCIIINDIIEKHFIIGKKNKEKMVADIIDKLKMTKDQAEEIYESSMSIIGGGIKEKLKHPFKSQN